MTTAITKESLAARIADLEYGPRSLKEDYTLAAYKMLLATMEAEPVCFVSESNLATLTKYRAAVKVKAEPVMVRPVALYYHAQPAPVVPEEATPENVEMLSGYVSTYKLTDSERDIAAEIWNACRAAMLNLK